MDVWVMKVIEYTCRLCRQVIKFIVCFEIIGCRPDIDNVNKMSGRLQAWTLKARVLISLEYEIIKLFELCWSQYGEFAVQSLEGETFGWETSGARGDERGERIEFGCFCLFAAHGVFLAFLCKN